ncbi:MAG: hypothetical protein Q9216_001999 [Gyalolechia sp. 2 TL-2023]
MQKREAPDSAGVKTTKRTKATHSNTAVSTAMPRSNGVAATDGGEENILTTIDRIRKALTTPNSSSAKHAELLADISRLQLVVETPLDTIYRIGHQVISRLRGFLWIALELGVFDVLVAKREDQVGIQELARTCGADAILLAVGLCAESGVEEYRANSKTKIMTIPQGISSFKTWFDIFTPAAAKLPEYMHSRDYRNPTQSTTSAFAYANGSEFWNHLNQTPTQSQIFNDFMATRREGRPNWYDVYPIDRELSPSQKIDTDIQEESDVLLVDVGGNRGHDLVNLRAKYPDLVGKMVLQDLPAVVAHASFGSEDGIAAMPHDFFQPQPIQHARVYHFRAIFHDWPDSSCHQILAHIAAAMKPNFSKLLISEFVLSDTNTALFPATLDIQMMGLHAGMERSERQWRSLLESAGLEVAKIWQEVRGGEGVIEARLKA